MEFQPINLAEVMGIGLGMLVVLVPIFGLTVRFAAMPLVEALVRAGLIGPRSQTVHDAELGRLSRRVLELEQELSRRKVELLPSPVSDERAEALPAELRRLRT